MVHSIPKFKTKAQMPNAPRAPKLEKRRKISGHSELHLPKAVKAKVKAYEYVEIKSESPWKSFQKVFELKMNDFIIVTTQNIFLCKIVIMKILKTRDKLDML